MLEVGATAPDFSLPGVHAGEPRYYNLVEELRADRTAVLLFAPTDFVPTVTPDFVAAGEASWRDREDVLTLAITADSLFAHEAYADARGIDCPILTDRFASIADAYDVVHEEWRAHREVPQRAAFVVDPEWEVHFAWAAADPLVTPEPSPLVGVADALSAVLDEPVRAPDVDYE